MPVTDIKTIRELYKKLKKDRIVLTYEEFSERVGYHRTYISRVLNGHEDLTEDILKKINETDFSERKNVPRETQKPTTKGELIALRAAVKVLSLSVQELKMKESGKSLVEISQEFEKRIKHEIEQIQNEQI